MDSTGNPSLTIHSDFGDDAFEDAFITANHMFHADYHTLTLHGNHAFTLVVLDILSRQRGTQYTNIKNMMPVEHLFKINCSELTFTATDRNGRFHLIPVCHDNPFLSFNL